MVGLMRQNQLVELVLYRNGIRESVQARIGGSTGQAIPGNSAVSISNEFRGAKLKKFKRNSYINHGIEVVSLSQFGAAWAAELREGDVIVEVNRRSIADMEAFNSATSVTAADSRGGISALTVIREGRKILMFL